MTSDSETMEKYLNFIWTRCLISVLVFVSRDYELGRVSDFGGVDRQSRTGLIFIFLHFICRRWRFSRSSDDDARVLQILMG